MTGCDLLAGRYALGGVLGRGGMAEVREGRDTRLDRPVAVKLLHAGYAERADLRRRFADEARAAARLAHPNIVAVHDFGEHDGTPFIVMERLSGRTLADVMADGPMAPAHVRALLEQVLSALHTAHSAGVLHRDIKPANILVSANGVKVADFGIAKTGGAAHTMTGQIFGTLSYLSPDRVMGGPASASDDLYAIGLVAYEALLGRPVYGHDDNIAAVARAITDQPLPPVSTFRGDVDPVLAAVVDRAVARDPRIRFATADQMGPALAGVSTAHRPRTRVLQQPPTPAPVGARHTRRGTYAVAAGILVALAVAALAVAMGPFSSPPPPEPVSTSTAVPPPPTTSIAPSPPPTTTQATPVYEPPPQKKPKGDGHPGRGNGNGKH